MELEMKGYAAKHDRLMPAAHALRTAIAEAEKQEPVAWMWKDGTMTFDADRADGTWTPLYTTPPAAQRQWVGFTDEEINEYDYEHRDFIYDIEALLKHKNTRLG
jgi:hypothetical protein